VSGTPRGVMQFARVTLAAPLAVMLLAGPASALDRPANAGRDPRPTRVGRVADARGKLARRADSSSSAGPRGSGARSPGSRPLIASPNPGETEALDEPGGEGSPVDEVDPLVSNGLGSPLCAGATSGAMLSATSRRDCETSGFVATAAPTGNFGVDVHIDTGLLPSSSGSLLKLVQELFVTPVWMALVWAVHALVVMLEWCFTIDLLDSGSVSVGLAKGLRQMQAAFTIPWMASVLAVAAVLCAYNGLVRRRVADSVGQVLLALAMMAGGSWAMLDPSGTIGALGGWANQASLGTLAVTAHGTPTGADRALADSMGTVFAAIVEVPWCYLEFGDVGWCRNPARLDPRLHSAALAIARAELGSVGCQSSKTPLAACASGGSEQAKALEHSARLLRAAQTNGSVFLALPANGPARNSINDSESLLRAICRRADATSCRGSTAAEAEFRTNNGTWPRVGGLLLIAVGVLGMLLLLGFVALRLLAAAVFSLLYLMLAPAVVLAPALGEGGRALFRKWAARLLGAIVSKLLFSFLLGTILAILGILANLEALGWWTQWLLMSAFWWAAFAQRHQALQFVAGGRESGRSGGRRAAIGHLNEMRDARRKTLDRAQSVKQRLSSKPAPEPGGGTSRRPSDLPSIGAAGGRSRAPSSSRSAARHAGDAGPDSLTGSSAYDDARAAAMRERLEHLGSERARALVVGNTRRAARLSERAARVLGEGGTGGVDESRRAGTGEPHRDSSNGRAEGAGGDASSATLRLSSAERMTRFLDTQSALPAGGDTRTGEARRSYAALAGLSGYSLRDYERLASHEKHAARLRIDRELAARRERTRTGRGEPQWRDGRSAAGESQLPAATRRRGVAPARPDPPRQSESSLMRDAREVAARRKRQLGEGRP
jgi:hypothetical protein